MNSQKMIIKEIAEAITSEKALVEYYKDAAERTHDTGLAHKLHVLEDRHFVSTGRMVTLRESLQKHGGEGFFGNAFEAIGHALVDSIAGLPVGAIRKETTPTVEMLVRMESTLCELYERILHDANANGDAETVPMVEATIKACRDNIETLHGIPGL